MTTAVSHRPADLDRAAVGHRSAVIDRPAVGDRQAFINRIGTAVPANDIHAPFIAFARTLLGIDRSHAHLGNALAATATVAAWCA